MPNQTVGNVHVNALLSNLARKYMPSEAEFIADQVCPRIPVANETDQYAVFEEGPFFATDVDDLVPDRAKPRKIEFEHSYELYKTERRELAWDISDRERKNADSPLRLAETRQQGVLARLLIKREVRVANLLRKTSNGGSLNLGAAASAKWDAAATDYQDIATDVMAGRAAVRQAIGTAPNVIVVPAAVAEGMHKSLLFQLFQQTPGAERLLTQPFPVLPPTLFGMRVLVPGQLQNTAHEGQTASFSDIWGEAVRLLYVTPGAATEEPSVAYTFQSEPLTTRQWRDEEARVDSYAVGNTIVEKIVAPDSGYEISDCLT